MVEVAEEYSQAINAKDDRSYELNAVMTFTGQVVRWQSLMTEGKEWSDFRSDTARISYLSAIFNPRQR